MPKLDGGPGPALPIDDAAMRAMVAAAIDGGGPGGGEGASGSESGGGLSTAAKYGLGLLGLGGALVAVLVLGGVFEGDSEPPPPAVAQPAVEPEAEPIEAEPVPIEPAEPEPVEMAPVEVEHKPARTPRRPSPPAKPAAESPDDLLQLANDARKRRAWREADGLYRRVWNEHAGSRAAYVARVASAQLNLGKLDRPSAALTLFRQALAQEPRGFLTEEARFGVAQALRELGRAADERAALERFLADHPKSAFARRARARLAELEGDEP